MCVYIYIYIYILVCGWGSVVGVGVAISVLKAGPPLDPVPDQALPLHRAARRAARAAERDAGGGGVPAAAVEPGHPGVREDASGQPHTGVHAPPGHGPGRPPHPTIINI